MQIIDNLLIFCINNYAAYAVKYLLCDKQNFAIHHIDYNSWSDNRFVESRASADRIYNIWQKFMTRCVKKERRVHPSMNEDAHSAWFDPVRNQHQVTHQFICVHKTGLFWATRRFFLRILTAITYNRRKIRRIVS